MSFIRERHSPRLDIDQFICVYFHMAEDGKYDRNQFSLALMTARIINESPSEYTAFDMIGRIDHSARGPYGETALHIAAAYDRADCIDSLVEKGAPTDVKDMLGRTPAALARQLGHHRAAAAIDHAARRKSQGPGSRDR